MGDPADSRDIHSCLEFIRTKLPTAEVHIVGYSMGASMVLLYCGKYGDESLCTSAVAVSGSFTPSPLHCLHYQRYWQPWLTAQLKLLFYGRFGNELPPKSKVVNASTYIELIYNLPHIGPVSKFCERGSADAVRQGICRPLLFFAAADDAFHYPVESLGIDPSLPFVLYYITEVGGHVAWPEGWAADCNSFQTRVVLGFFEASSASHTS